MLQGLSAVEKTLSTSTGLDAAATGQSIGKAVETSFSDALATAAANTVGKLEKAEGLSLQALHGKADTREVVDAVMSAEQTLQAAIAIRDKIVTAYLEISRMAI